MTGLIDKKTIAKLLNGAISATCLKNATAEQFNCTAYGFAENDDGRTVLYMLLDDEYYVTASEPFIKSFKRIVSACDLPFTLLITKHEGKIGRTYLMADIL